VLVVVAGAFASRRDVGRGLWPDRRGHAHASKALLSPIGLAWRLQRGAFYGWAVALVMFGLIFGNLTEQIQHVEGHAKNWWTQAGGTDVVVDAYRVSIIQIAGMFVAVYVVQVLLRMRVDENGGTLESVLAAGVTRAGWMWGHSMGLTAGQVLGHTGTQVRELVWAGLVQVPGILVVGAVVVLAVAVLPRWSVTLSWAVLIGAFVVGPMFGPSLGLPTWVQDLSPFTHSPKAPVVAVTAGPVLALVVVSVVAGIAALVMLRRRNLALPA
jgi:ABC-2 type transport system permease protein